MKLELVPMTITEANDFVLNFHRHNKPVLSARFAIGASNGTHLVGVAIVGRPCARMLQDGWTAEVTRTCVVDNSPKGTCSFLYSACWRAWKAMGGKRLITYTLTSESGSSLRGAGWKVVAQCSPGTWDRAKRKREWQPIYGQSKMRWEMNTMAEVAVHG
jgi:hypothetical protein